MVGVETVRYNPADGTSSGDSRGSGIDPKVVSPSTNPAQPSILARADEIVNGARAAVYGHPRVNMGRISKLWSALLGPKLVEGAEITMTDVCMLMVALKLSRLVESPEHDETWMDAAGYVAVWEKLKEIEILGDAAKIPTFFTPGDKVVLNAYALIYGPSWMASTGKRQGVITHTATSFGPNGCDCIVDVNFGGVIQRGVNVSNLELAGPQGCLYRT